MKNKQKIAKPYMFIGKTLFFPEQKVLVIGDLHMGYEQMLHEQGLMFPFDQIKRTITDLKEIFNYLEKKKLKIKKVILLGDIKHYFGFEKTEKFGIFELINFLRKYVSDKNIIFIKGNHDKFDVLGKKFHNLYIFDDIAFIHGHKSFPEIYDKKINLIIMSHIHPTITLSDEQNVKKEKYKCFLIGKFKNKEIIILPSFFPLVEGAEISLYRDKFSIIPKSKLKNFDVYIIGEDLKVFEFEKLKK